MDVIRLCVKLEMFKRRNIVQMLEDMVVNLPEVGLLLFWEIEGEINGGDVNRGIRKSNVSLSVQGSELFIGSFYGVEFMVVYSN